MQTENGGVIIPSQYDTKTRAEVIADARLGKTSVQISEERNIPPATVGDWVHKAKEDSRDPMLVDGEYRLAFQAQQLTEDALQSLRDSKEPLYKYLVPLTITRGTAIDKIFKAKELAQKEKQTEAGQALIAAVNRLADLSVPQLNTIIEGEAKEIG